MRDITYHARLKVDVGALGRPDVVVSLLLRQLESARLYRVSKGQELEEQASTEDVALSPALTA